MVSEPATARLVPRLGEETDGKEALGGRRGSVGGSITRIHEKRRREPRKNGEMDWVKLSSVTPLTEQPANVTPLTVVKTA